MLHYAFAFTAVIGLSMTAAAQDNTHRLEDLAVFERDVLGRDASYSIPARAEAHRRLAALKEAPLLSDAAFELALSGIMALADNGHTLLLSARWATAFNRIPLRFLIAEDGLFVGSADAVHAELVGCRIERIAGHGWHDLQSAWARYQGGEVGWRNQFIYYFIESPELLHAAGLAPSPEEVEILFDGCAARTVRALPPDAGKPEYIAPSRLLQLSQRGLGGPAPLYLREPEQLFRVEPLAEHGAVYLQFRANADFSGAQDLAALARQAEETLRAQSPRYIILDQRMNPGGDLNNTRDLMQALPEIVGPEGHIYLLLSGRTFSAGISSAGYAKQAAGERITLIGSPPGDRLEFWAEGPVVFLPHSGAAFLAATERHNYMTGCPEDDCHDSIRRHPIRIDHLIPDIPVDLKYSDFAAGRDPLMERALAEIARRQ